MKTKNTDVPIWDRRRPKFLLSGLMSCGCCGGGFSKVSKDGLAGLLRLACGLPVHEVSAAAAQMQKAPRGAGRGN